MPAPVVAHSMPSLAAPSMCPNVRLALLRAAALPEESSVHVLSAHLGFACMTAWRHHLHPKERRQLKAPHPVMEA